MFVEQRVYALQCVSTSSGLLTWVGFLTPAFAEQSALMSIIASCLAACFAKHGHKCGGVYKTSRLLCRLSKSICASTDQPHAQWCTNGSPPNPLVQVDCHWRTTVHVAGQSWHNGFLKAL